MIGNKLNGARNVIGMKHNQSFNGIGHKFSPTQSSGTALTNGQNIIEQHRQLDPNQPTGLNIKKSQTLKKSSLEK
jgi:hypothetical protein